MRPVENGYRHVHSDNAKDRVAVECGDLKDRSQFHPQIKLNRWGTSEAENECNLSIRAEGVGVFDGAIDGKIKWKGPDYDVHMYDKPNFDQFGAFEFEWILAAKPARNFLDLSVQHKGLKLFQQPNATSGIDAEGPWQCPENVAGSIALYHESKGALVDANGMEYRSGKFGHVFRPEAVDANGNRVWCDLVIVNPVKWRVAVPQAFLDAAHDANAYPVIVDPTIGYTTAGGTSLVNWGAANTAIGSIVSTVTAVSGDTITSFSVYTCKSQFYTDSGNNVSFAAYTMSSGQPASRLAAVVDAAVTAAFGAPIWESTATVSQGLSAGSDYCVATSAQNSGVQLHDLFHDAGSVPGRFNSTSTTLDSSFSPTGTDSGRHYSWYATYTAGGGSSIKTVDGLAEASVKTVNDLANASVKTIDGLA